jgi:hypothetical protein
MLDDTKSRKLKNKQYNGRQKSTKLQTMMYKTLHRSLKFLVRLAKSLVFCVHEVTGPDTLKEIHQACGGHYGGNTVNQEFFKFLGRLFGGPVIQEIRTKHPSEYFELMYWNT